MELGANESLVTERHMSMERVECNALCYDANSDKLFSVWGDGCIYVWDVETRRTVSKLSCHSNGSGTSGTSSGTSGSGNDVLSDGEQRLTVGGGAVKNNNNERILCVTNSLKTNLLYAGCSDGSIRVWDTSESMEELMVDVMYPMVNNSNNGSSHSTQSKVAHNQNYSIYSISVDADGNWLVFSLGYYIVILHIGSKTVTSIIPSQSFVNFVTFTSDSRIATGGCDPYVRIFEISGQFVAKYKTNIPTLLSLNVNLDRIDQSSGHPKDIIVAVGMTNRKNVFVNGILAEID